MSSSKVPRIIKASRKSVYNAFVDPKSVAIWLAPDNMRGEVHTFDTREGGTFRISLIYLDAHSSEGKTSKGKDTFQDKFAELVPYKKIVEVVEFESTNPRR
jgi:uncharacterized protein YndB with AHSA1/START domain